MAIIRAQVILRHLSGLARDNAVNTFHFNGPTDEPTLVDLRDSIGRFYYEPLDIGAGVMNSVGKFLANHLGGVMVKLYDVTDEPAGPPILVSGEWGLPARAAADDLPSEVAMCLSFEGTPAAGLDQSRRRGRVYIGPLNQGAAGPGPNAVRIPTPGFATTLRMAGSRLALEVDDSAEMVVYSRPYAGRGANEEFRADGTPLPAIAARAGSTVGIDRFWTDDALDTQRRRGERPTAKVYLDSAG